MVGQGKTDASSKNSKRKHDDSENVVEQSASKKAKVVVKVNASGTNKVKRKPSDKIVAKRTNKVKRTSPGKVASKVTRNSKPKQSEKASASSKMKAKKKKGPSTSNKSSSQKPAQESAKRLEQIKGKVEKNLLCSICQDIFHDCISLQPCLHSFCSGCYSPWMNKSDKCPTCRLKVIRISKNHIVNNLVESFLSQFPERKRTDSDLKDLDARNTITQDMLYPKTTSSRISSPSDSEISSDAESESSFINVFDMPDFDPNNSELSCLSSETPSSDDMSSDESSLYDGNSTPMEDNWSSYDDSSSDD